MSFSFQVLTLTSFLQNPPSARSNLSLEKLVRELISLLKTVSSSNISDPNRKNSAITLTKLKSGFPIKLKIYTIISNPMRLEKPTYLLQLELFLNKLYVKYSYIPFPLYSTHITYETWIKISIKNARPVWRSATVAFRVFPRKNPSLKVPCDRTQLETIIIGGLGLLVANWGHLVIDYLFLWC